MGWIMVCWLVLNVNGYREYKPFEGPVVKEIGNEHYLVDFSDDFKAKGLSDKVSPWVRKVGDNDCSIKTPKR